MEWFGLEVGLGPMKTKMRLGRGWVAGGCWRVILKSQLMWKWNADRLGAVMGMHTG